MKTKLLSAFIISILFSVYNFSQTQNYYLGTGTPADPQNTSCASCHNSENIGSPIYDEWKNTKHAIAQDSLVSDHYGYSCLGCHNTGWNTSVFNYGADEYVVKDTTHTPNYVVTDPENWNRVKNVGCEACHGPMGKEDRTLAQSHWQFGTGNKLPYESQICGTCHDGAHHPYMTEWSQSAHANSAQTGFVVNNKACVKCHVSQNFIMFAKDPENYRDTILVTGTDIQPITCQTCHDPHSSRYTSQLRFPISNASTICDQCHNAEIDSVDINSEPHHTTAEVLSGSPLFGYQYPGEVYINSGHTYAAQERCVDCHVHAVEEGSLISTGHNFEPKTEACAKCHADYYSVVDTSNHAARFDYRGIQSRTDSLINVLSQKLANASSQDSATDAFKEANYNLLSIEQEGSRGIHNTRLVQKLLRDAIARFSPLAVESEPGVPMQYSLSQNYPNPFNPATEIKFSIPEAGNVRIVIYDITGKEVTTLVNEYRTTGNYKVSWNAGGFSSGVYLYRIETKSFVMTKKMVLIK